MHPEKGRALVQIPRILKLYQLLDERPRSAQELSALMGHRYSTIHAWLTALQACDLIRPDGRADKPPNRRGLFSMLWSPTKRVR